jgi:phosphoglycerol transferase MdoB-like AlkP superfamily enzyme
VNSPIFFACLAEGWVIEKSYQISCYSALIAAAVAVALFGFECYRGRFAWWPVYGALLVAHPGWRMWPSFHSGVLAVSSDCGYSDRFVSVAIVVVFVSLLLLLLLRPDFSRRVFLLVLAVVCWQLYFATWLFWHYRPIELPPNALLAAIFASEAMQAFTMSTGRLLGYSIILSISTAAVWMLTSFLRRTQSNQAMQRTAPRSDA